MTATGFAFFVTPLLSQLDAPVAQTPAILLPELYAVLGHADPDVADRRPSCQQGERLMVGAFVLPLLVGLAGCCSTTTTRTSWTCANADVAACRRLQRRSFCAGALTFAVVILRFHAASAPRRRALLPSLAGAVVLLLFVLVLLTT